MFRRYAFFLLLLFYVIAILIAHQGEWLCRPGPQNPVHVAPHVVKITGLVSGAPRPTLNGITFELDAETLTLLKAGEKPMVTGASGLVLVVVKKTTDTIVQPGDRIQVSGHLEAPQPPKVPGAFNYALFLKQKNIHSLLYTSPEHIIILGFSGTNQFQRWGFQLHRHFVNTMNAFLPAHEAMVLSGLAAGERPNQDPDIKRIFIDSGTMHILVASGANVAFVVFLWLMLTRLLRRPHTMGLLSSVPIIFLYVLAAGADAPIVRAGLMAVTFVVAHTLQRNTPHLHLLALAAFVMLLLNPMSLFDVGFQMSFITVFGLVYFLKPLQNFIPFQKTGAAIPINILAATLTAQAWVFPLTVHVFKNIVPVSIFSNLVILPLSAAGLPLGFLLWGLGSLTHAIPAITALAHAVAWGIHLYLTGLICMTRFFANISPAYWLSPLGSFFTVGYYTLLLSLVPALQQRWAKVIFVGALILTLTAWFWPSQEIPPPHIRITWVDAGRSTIALVETPKNKPLIFIPRAATFFDSVDRVVLPFLMEKKIHYLSALILDRLPMEERESIEKFLRQIPTDTVVLPSTLPRAFIGQWPNLAIKTKLHFLSSTHPFQKENLLLALIGPNRKTPKFPVFTLETTGPNNRPQGFIFSTYIPLRIQDYFLEQKHAPLQVLQTHWSAHIHWRENWLTHVRPTLLVEPGRVSDDSTALRLWAGTKISAPQKCGVVTFEN